MNATQLLEHFDRLAEAPRAVPRLRRFILDLAVRGKLVEQEAGDEPAAELLKRIQTEKARLVKTGSLKASKLQPANEDVDSSLIPDSWRWTRLVDVGFISPRNAAPDDQLVSFVPMPMIAADYGTPNQHEVRPWREIKTGYTHFAEGDVGLAKITPCFENGKSTVFRGLTNGIGAGTTELHIVRPVFLNADYILIYLKSSQYIATGIPRMTGTAGQKRVPTEYFTQTPFPLPPLAEQHRIVAKVDELMALCDQLEAAQQERECRRDRLTAASLQRLNQPATNTTSETQLEHAHFHLHNLPRLTTRPEHIKAMRQTILNLAVRGLLVPHDATDIPATVLLKEIQTEKSQLLRVGAIPKEKTAAGKPSLTFTTPELWQVVRLGDVCNLVTSGSRGWAEFYAESGPKFLRAQNIRFGRLRLDQLACVNPPARSEGARTQVQQGDLLIVITGAGVTNPALLDRDLGEAYVSQHVALVRPSNVALARWLLLCLMAGPSGRDELVERAYGAGKPGLNLDNIRSLNMPIPPLAEQHRIVAKVDELMALCDQLEAQLTTTQTDSSRLLEAILETALIPA
jgi:type I restriction enzyme S subunit